MCYLEDFNLLIFLNMIKIITIEQEKAKISKEIKNQKIFVFKKISYIVKGNIFLLKFNVINKLSFVLINQKRTNIPLLLIFEEYLFYIEYTEIYRFL